MSAASTSDVETALGRPLASSEEAGQIQWWLDGIELVIKGRLGPVAALDQDVLIYVEAEAVAGKVARHGTRESSITVAVDDGSITRRYDTPASVADITDEWWNLLDPDSNTASSSIRPGFEADTAWWSVRTPGCFDRIWS